MKNHQFYQSLSAESKDLRKIYDIILKIKGYENYLNVFNVSSTENEMERMILNSNNTISNDKSELLNKLELCIIWNQTDLALELIKNKSVILI